MSSAGWVSTTLNYIWPFIFEVLSFIPLYNNDIKQNTYMAIYNLYYSFNLFCKSRTNVYDCIMI